MSYHIPSMTSLDEARAVELRDALKTLEGTHTKGEENGNEKSKEVDGDVPEDEADRHHSGGFSAQAFASYEERLKTTTSKAAPAGTGSVRSSGATFESASDLEKGVMGEVLKPVPSAHTRHISTTSLDTLNLPVPAKRQSRIVRNVRHTSLNVYRRLFSLVFAGNMIGLIIFLAKNSTATEINLSHLATAASANFLVAIIIRQDYIVNLLFRTCWIVPHSAPLRIRRMLAKVYEHGGVHSGCAVAGSVWFLLLTVVLTIQFVDSILRSIPILTLTYVLLTLLFAIIIFAYPRFRFMSHNTFEISHRFAGWTAIGIFWAECMLLVDHFRKVTGHSFGHELITLPTFWFLAVITFHLVLPWIRLRKWHFHPEQLSTHALRLNFDTTLAPLSGLAISESPLKEWHPFATFPKAGGGGSMIISNAGDWTKRTILEPKTRYWVKGVPKTGVLSMAFVFRRVVVVTTGSGIGPCLSFLMEPSRKTKCRVLWSTPSPLKTYGQGIYNSVLQSDPKAIIIDTRASGRPDMVAITYNMFIESGAEAVFCISNPRLTKKIVYGMEARGVPAFGPIWDS